jgi:hypothetical protein
MSQHLGYGAGQAKPEGATNHRNGTSATSKLGASLVADWIELNNGSKLAIRDTEVFQEFTLLKSIEPDIRIKRRGEQAAVEIASELVDGGFNVMLGFKEDLKEVKFLTPSPAHVSIISFSVQGFGGD